MHCETQLLEIDLLRQGVHTVAAPMPLLQQRGTWDYLACLHRSAQPNQYAYWLIHLRAPLPLLRVPLTDGESDAVLDLQAVFDRAYDSGRYLQEINYREAPSVPLEGEDVEWLETLLRVKGFRS